MIEAWNNVALGGLVEGHSHRQRQLTVLGTNESVVDVAIDNHIVGVSVDSE